MRRMLIILACIALLCMPITVYADEIERPIAPISYVTAKECSVPGTYTSVQGRDIPYFRRVSGETYYVRLDSIEWVAGSANVLEFYVGYLVSSAPSVAFGGATYFLRNVGDVVEIPSTINMTNVVFGWYPSPAGQNDSPPGIANFTLSISTEPFTDNPDPDPEETEPEETEPEETLPPYDTVDVPDIGQYEDIINAPFNDSTGSYSVLNYLGKLSASPIIFPFVIGGIFIMISSMLVRLML